MAGRNLNGKYSICRIEVQSETDVFNYFTVRWGYDTEEKAIADLEKVAIEEALTVSDLAVVGVVFSSDL